MKNGLFCGLPSKNLPKHPEIALSDAILLVLPRHSPVLHGFDAEIRTDPLEARIHAPFALLSCLFDGTYDAPSVAKRIAQFSGAAVEFIV